MIGRNEWIALGVCALLSLAVFVGSTGLGYAVYRPLRYYDVFSIVISWLGLFFYIWRGRRPA
jgi:hypothetical protein